LRAAFLWLFAASLAPTFAADPARAEVLAGLKKAATFFHDKCSHHGGYVWRISTDLKLSEGEGETTDSMCWVQPPGTPAVGLAMLDAFDATGDRWYFDVAREAALALAGGQMQSGGWYYSIEFDPAKRTAWGYRDNTAFRPDTKKGRDEHNLTMLDDDVTTAVFRLLLRVNKVLNGKDAKIADALKFGLDAVLASQAPNGGWRHNWDRYPTPMKLEDFPAKPASYPESWPRVWPNDWRGVHYLNDNVAGNALATMLLAHELTGDPRCLAAAKKTGDFFILAQMPDPQPAWAQQYNATMQPVWDRKFEPPAITGRESQQALDALLLLARKTGDQRYLAPVPRALEYLKKSRLPDGRLARFYELQTNKPLYFKVTGKRYDLTYDASDLPDHYAFIVSSRLGGIEAEYQRVRAGAKTDPPPAPMPEFAAHVLKILATMDARGAWVDARGMKGHGKASPEGVIQSETFNDNVALLCRWLREHPER
jgi:PelA/Pel-15E family pectate lyase